MTLLVSFLEKKVILKSGQIFITKIFENLKTFPKVLMNFRDFHRHDILYILKHLLTKSRSWQ